MCLGTGVGQAMFLEPTVMVCDCRFNGSSVPTDENVSLTSGYVRVCLSVLGNCGNLPQSRCLVILNASRLGHSYDPLGKRRCNVIHSRTC